MANGKTDRGPGRTALNEPVWVKCKDFRCLAYVGADGRWRAFSNDRALPGPIQVLRLDRWV